MAVLLIWSSGLASRVHISGCLSYCHDTNLRRAKWFAEAGIEVRMKKGGRLQLIVCDYEV
jgi:hypothetical protein